MKDKNWLQKALLLGFVFFIAVFLIKPVGVSTQFSLVSGLVHSQVDSQVIQEDPAQPGVYTSENAYYAKSKGKLIKSMQNPWNYSLIFVLASPVGAYAAHMSQKTWLKPSQPKAPVGGGKLFLSGFLGGCILLYGARMAGG